MKKAAIIVIAALAAAPRTAGADVVHADDVIVQGSECVGNDCVNNEDFGFDTLRLRENNLRIHFDDTSTVAGFPANDWRITVNDDTGGGAAYFAVEDATAGTRPLTIRAGARTDSLCVDSAGRIGLGTLTPAQPLHLVSGNTPALRLEQDGSAGFTPWIWDVAGHETNFFIRDVNAGSALPFRIEARTPSNTLTLRASGDVGLGTWSPEATLDVRRADGSARVRVLESSAEIVPRELLTLENSGPPLLALQDVSTGDRWRVGIVEARGSGGHFAINRDDGDGAELLIFKSGAVRMGTGRRSNLALSPRGNLALRGVLSQNSDVNAKVDIARVDGAEVLERIAALEIATWSYRDEGPAVRHMGPMAQDFRAAFGLGETATSIAAIDADGVALAGIRELQRRLREKEALIAGLQERLAALEGAVQDLAANLPRR